MVKTGGFIYTDSPSASLLQSNKNTCIQSSLPLTNANTHATDVGSPLAEQFAHHIAQDRDEPLMPGMRLPSSPPLYEASSNHRSRLYKFQAHSSAEKRPVMWLGASKCHAQLVASWPVAAQMSLEWRRLPHTRLSGSRLFLLVEHLVTGNRRGWLMISMAAFPPKSG